MTLYERGAIVLLPFPFTDQSVSKRRPALIICTNEYNARRGDLIVAPITSSVSIGQSDDIPLADWARSGLLKASVVKGILGTIERSLVLRVLGSLSKSDMRRT